MKKDNNKKYLKNLIKFILIISISIVAFTILLLFLQFPGIKTTEKQNKINEMKNFKYIAHRGYFSTNPLENRAENTINAFEAAVINNYAIELDVHLTKDNELAVIHDSTLTENAIKFNENELNQKQLEIKDKLLNKKVFELNMSDLKNISSEFSLYGTDSTIPTLEEAYNAIKNQLKPNQKTMILIEIKADNKNTKKYINKLSEAVSDFIDSKKDENILLVVQSFHPLVLNWFKKNNPYIPRGFLAISYQGKYPGDFLGIGSSILKNLYTNFLSRPDFIAYAYQNNVKDTIPFKAYRKLYKPHTLAWTIKTMQDVDGAFNNGYNSLIFDTIENPKK